MTQIAGIFRKADADILVESDTCTGKYYNRTKYEKLGMLRASDIEPVLANYTDHISDFGYVSCSLFHASYDRVDTVMSDLARLQNYSLSISAITPSHLIDDSIQKGHVDTETGLGLSE